MNSFLNPHNGTSLIGIIDITAHIISLFQENAPPKNIEDTFIPKSDISIAEPYGVIIDEFGNDVISMYQFFGDINDKSGWVRIDIKLYERNFFSKNEPAVNEHCYHITKNNIMKIYIIFMVSVKVSLIR